MTYNHKEVAPSVDIAKGYDEVVLKFKPIVAEHDIWTAESVPRPPPQGGDRAPNQSEGAV